MKAQHVSLMRKLRDLEGMLRIVREQTRQLGIELNEDGAIPEELTEKFSTAILHPFNLMSVNLIIIESKIDQLSDYDDDNAE